MKARVAKLSSSSVNDDTVGKVQTQELRKSSDDRLVGPEHVMDWLSLSRDALDLDPDRRVLAGRLVASTGTKRALVRGIIPSP